MNLSSRALRSKGSFDAGTQRHCSRTSEFLAPVARLLVVGIFVVSAASANATGPIVTLRSPSSGDEVTLELAPDAQGTQPRNTGFLVFHVEYPSGKPLLYSPVAIPSPSVLRITLEPAGVHKTRTEWMVSRALPQRPASPNGREWLVREEHGARVYAYRTRQGDEPETHVFTATDGSLVGVQMAYPPFVMNRASRRYLGGMEVTYSAPRAIDPRRMDDFVLTFLKSNVSILVRSK